MRDVLTGPVQAPPVSAPSPPPRRRATAWLGPIVSAVALAGCVWWVTKQDAPRLPGSFEALASLFLAVGVYAGATLTRGWRWHRLLADSQLPHTRADAFALVPVMYMGNTVLPARAGEALRIVLLSRRTGARKRDITGTVVAERLLDAVTLAALLVVLALTGLAHTSAGNWPAIAAAAGVVGVVVGGLALLRLRTHPRIAPYARRAAPLLRSSARLFTTDGLRLITLTIAVWGMEGLVFSLVGHSLDLQIDVLDGLVLVVLSSFLTLIPAAPAYAGTFDAAIVLGLRAMSVTGSAAFGYTLLLRAVLFVPVTVAGLIIVVARYGGLRRSLADSRQDEPAPSS